MRVVIIGSGFGASVHLPAFRALDEVEVVAVADSGSGKIRNSLPGGIAYLPSWREALAISADAVCVVVPPAFQGEIVSTAIEAERHVLCDKPFGADLVEAEDLCSEATVKPNLVSCVNYQFRFEPGIQELKNQIAGDVVGKIHAIDFTWLTGGRADPDTGWTWRNDIGSGGGTIGAFFSHAADLIWWLTQKEVISVFGKSRILVPERPDESGVIRKVTAEDMITAQLELEDDIDVSCRITNCQRGGNGMRIEIRGSKGIISYQHEPPFSPENQSMDLSLLGGGRCAVSIPKSQAYLNLTDTRLWAVQELAKLFVGNIRGEENADLPDFKDGARAHRVMSALHRSSDSNQIVQV